MPYTPYPMSNIRSLDELIRKTQMMFQDLYEDRIGGALLGDIFSIGDDDVLAVDIADDGGLEKSSNELQIKNHTTGGLRSTSDGEAIKLKATGGLGTDADGLYISSSTLRGFRKGCIVTIKDATNLYVGSGAIDVCGANYTIDTTQTVALGSPSDNTLYYIYVNAPTTGLVITATNITVSATAPTWNDNYGAYYQTGDATKRYIARYVNIT